MSTVGQGVGGVIGAVVGFVVGGPTGALYGAQVGMSIGGYLDPPKGPTVHGPRLNDLSVQTSTYGQGIPRIYGTVALSGNVLWLENNKLKEVVKKKKSGGKGGGGGTTTKTYTYFATFALALCEGEIAGVRRIWCMDKLIYNAGSDDLETIIASNQAAKGWRLYRGTDDQLPDSRMEADIGVGRTPAYRGLAYLVFDDFALADYSNTLQAAQFKVEVVQNATFTGLRQRVSTQSGVQYANNPDTGAGVPYIYAMGDGGYVSAGGKAYRHTLNGNGGMTGTASASDFLPPAVSGVYSIGHVGGELLRVKANDSTYMNGVDIVLGGSAVTLDVAPALITGKKIAGATCSLRGEYIAIGFISDTQSIGSSNPGQILVFDQGFSLVRVLTVAQIGRLSPLAMGRSGDTLLGNFYASCLSEDGNSLYYCQGAANRSFEKYDISGNVATRIAFYNLSLAPGGTFTYPSIAESDGVIHIAAGTAYFIWVASDRLSLAPVLLSDVIANECVQSNLIAGSDLDTSLVSDEIRGYRVSGGSSRSVIEPLQGAYPFDVIQSGYKLKFVPRGQSSALSIPWDDLAANDGGEIGDMLAMPREMDTQLPQRVSITALSSTREYASTTQYAERLNTSAVNVEQRDIPLVLSDDEVAQMADKLLYLRWLERTDAELSLPPTYLGLEPSDVATVMAPYGVFELRLTEINYEADGHLTCKAKPNNAAIYISNAAGAVVPGPDGSVPLAGASLFVPLDIPLVDETLQNSPGFVGAMAGYSSGWPGGLAVRSIDDGQTWTDLQAYSGKCTIGYAQGVLSNTGCTLIDQRGLAVLMISGELESITRDQMLIGQNYAAYGMDGRWEIIRFQSASLQPDGRYLVSGFVRGDRGTEWAAGMHQDGDYFILLDDPDNAFIGMAVGSIGVPGIYRGVTSGASIDSASDVPFAYQGVNLECLSPVNARGARDGSGNFIGTFTRRSRLSSSWWANGVQAPVGETSEVYEIDVISGATVRRTITASTPSFSYSAADQSSDFGSPQASIIFRIYQQSSVVGRGYPLEVTL